MRSLTVPVLTAAAALTALVVSGVVPDTAPVAVAAAALPPYLPYGGDAGTVGTVAPHNQGRRRSEGPQRVLRHPDPEPIDIDDDVGFSAIDHADSPRDQLSFRQQRRQRHPAAGFGGGVAPPTPRAGGVEAVPSESTEAPGSGSDGANSNNENPNGDIVFPEYPVANQQWTQLSLDSSGHVLVHTNLSGLQYVGFYVDFPQGLGHESTHTLFDVDMHVALTGGHQCPFGVYVDWSVENAPTVRPWWMEPAGGGSSGGGGGSSAGSESGGHGDANASASGGGENNNGGGSGSQQESHSQGSFWLRLIDEMFITPLRSNLMCMVRPETQHSFQHVRPVVAYRTNATTHNTVLGVRRAFVVLQTRIAAYAPPNGTSNGVAWANSSWARTIEQQNCPLQVYVSITRTSEWEDRVAWLIGITGVLTVFPLAYYLLVVARRPHFAVVPLFEAQLALILFFIPQTMYKLIRKAISWTASKSKVLFKTYLLARLRRLTGRSGAAAAARQREVSERRRRRSARAAAVATATGGGECSESGALGSTASEVSMQEQERSHPPSPTSATGGSSAPSVRPSPARAAGATTAAVSATDEGSTTPGPTPNDRAPLLANTAASPSQNAVDDEPTDEDDEEPCCRICADDDELEDLIRPCACRGTAGYVHASCLDKWRLQSLNNASASRGVTNCEICNAPFEVQISRTIVARAYAERIFYYIAVPLVVLGSLQLFFLFQAAAIAPFACMGGFEQVYFNQDSTVTNPIAWFFELIYSFQALTVGFMTYVGTAVVLCISIQLAWFDFRTAGNPDDTVVEEEGEAAADGAAAGAAEEGAARGEDAAPGAVEVVVEDGAAGLPPQPRVDPFAVGADLAARQQEQLQRVALGEARRDGAAGAAARGGDGDAAAPNADERAEALLALRRHRALRGPQLFLHGNRFEAVRRTLCVAGWIVATILFLTYSAKAFVYRAAVLFHDAPSYSADSGAGGSGSDNDDVDTTNSLGGAIDFAWTWSAPLTILVVIGAIAFFAIAAVILVKRALTPRRRAAAGEEDDQAPQPRDAEQEEEARNDDARQAEGEAAANEAPAQHAAIQQMHD